MKTSRGQITTAKQTYHVDKMSATSIWHQIRSRGFVQHFHIYEGLLVVEETQTYINTLEVLFLRR